jgi:hypothetical protein
MDGWRREGQINIYMYTDDRLCGLVNRVPGYPVLPDFLRSSGSGMGPTQPREYKWGATWKKAENMAVGICHPDHVASSNRKVLALTSLTSGGHLVADSGYRAYLFFNFMYIYIYIYWYINNTSCVVAKLSGMKCASMSRQPSRRFC